MTDGIAPDCLCLTGPTATGKTALALELAAVLPIEIVSMDSAMVYRGLDIGTAKPSAATRTQVPHHLLDIREPNEAYSAGQFARDAAELIGAIRARGRYPVLVGGTLLYLRALRDGLAALPRADVQVRAALDAEGAMLGWAVLHERLRGIDPEAAARIAPSDRQRIQRALEVHALTGKPISLLQRVHAAAPRPRVLALSLVPDTRATLAARIEQRFDAMVANGFVAEVERLRARGDVTPEMPSLRAVGYRQVWAYLEHGGDFATARAKAIFATRQYAKRQLTWLRGDPHCEAWPAFAPDLLARLVQRLVAAGVAGTNN